MSLISLSCFSVLVICSSGQINVNKKHLQNEINQMPTVMKNLKILKSKCGDVCDTSDKFEKKPGKYFDIIKKDFKCDILLTSPEINPPLEIEEQMASGPINAFFYPNNYFNLHLSVHKCV